MSHYCVGTSHHESCNYESCRVSVQRVTRSQITNESLRVIPVCQDVRPHNRNQNTPSPPSMNPDPVPPVRPLLTHVIADGPLRREAGITTSTIHCMRQSAMFKITYGVPTAMLSASWHSLPFPKVSFTCIRSFLIKICRSQPTNSMKTASNFASSAASCSTALFHTFYYPLSHG